MSAVHKKSYQIILIGMAFLIVFPLFFTLNGKIFKNNSYNYDSMGDLGRLPIPVSVFPCFVSFFIFFYYRNSIHYFCFYLSFTTIILVTSFWNSDGLLLENNKKLLLILQIITPMLPITLGELFGSNKSNRSIFIKSTFFIVISIINAQLLMTLISGKAILSPSIYLFSIYQHLQYVSTIFISLYIISIFSLWDINFYKIAILIFTPLVGVYAQLSLSIISNFIFLIGLIIFSFHKWIATENKLPIILTIFAIVISLSTFWIFKDHEDFLQKYDFEKSILAKKSIQKNYIKSNLSQRLVIWKYYINRIFENKKTLFLGHSNPPNRNEYPSAHNYYLDLAYNFGFLSLIPIVTMIIFTFKKFFYLRKKIFEDASLLGVVIVFIFLLLVDNSFKVGLRQPYPGIITFFLWGFILSRLLHDQT